MFRKKYIRLLTAIFIGALSIQTASARTRLRDSTVQEISAAVASNRYDDAIRWSRNIIEADSSDPSGYFLLGAVYQCLSEEYRTDIYNEEIDDMLTHAIDRSNELKETDPDDPELYFISGAALGYRAIHRAFHGRWFKAFRDGLRCSSHLNESLEIDSTYYDAYWGLGSYKYYRTVYAKNFLWLPFVSDQREEGIAMIRKAIANGNLAGRMAREAFLRIYWSEKRHDDLINLADSLYGGLPDDAYILTYYLEGLLATDRLDEAEEKLMELKGTWKMSPYYDAAGVLESEYFMARVEYQRGDVATARKILEYIIEREDLRDTNAYFEETYEKAKKFLKEIK